MSPEKDSFAWFDEARLGLMIHWGIYSILGRGEQILFRERLDPVEYSRLAQKFNPRHYDPDDWMRQAADAGVKYAVLTAKHHDGFCLFDSAVSDYTSMNTAAGRDIVAEYVSACRKHGIRVGLYYSLADWTRPEYFRGPEKDPAGFNSFIDYTQTQVRELCTNYGSIDLLWFDGGWPWNAAEWQSEKLDDMIRELQPHVMINDRLHGGGGGNVIPVGDYSRRTKGYYTTAEQRPPDMPEDRPIETVRTTYSYWWGYTKGDPLWKSPREIVYLLTQASEAGANFLVNVGPKPDGSFPREFRRILSDAGSWMRDNGESIYNTKGGILDCCSFGRMTSKKNRAYLHVLYWPGREFTVYGLANEVKSAFFLATNEPVRFEQTALHIRLLDLPKRAPDPFDTVIVLDVDGTPARDSSVVNLWEDGRDTVNLAEWAEGGSSD